MGSASSGLWDLQGNAMVMPQYIRLTPDLQSKRGAVWNRVVSPGLGGGSGAGGGWGYPPWGGTTGWVRVRVQRGRFWGRGAGGSVQVWEMG